MRGKLSKGECGISMNMKREGGRAPRCVILTAYAETLPSKTEWPEDGDFIICADGGYSVALRAGLRPGLVIGDFDSCAGRVADGVDIERFPSEKDDTDTLLGLKRGLAMGFRDFLIIGGVGGRFDHSFANLQAVSYCLDMGGRAVMADGRNIIMMTDDRLFVAERREGFYLSLFSWSESCEGLCVEGAKYPLENFSLGRDNSLGVSNEFMEDSVTIKKKSGRLLIVLSRDGTGV